MTRKIEDKSRGQIADALPDAIAIALTSYQVFLEKDHHEDSKEFKTHHEACKVAISHLELLIKLAKWADLPDENASDESRQVMLAAMMKNAEIEVTNWKKTEK